MRIQVVIKAALSTSAIDADDSTIHKSPSAFYDDREPVFSPDGTQIAFSSDRPPAGWPAVMASGTYDIRSSQFRLVS